MPAPVDIGELLAKLSQFQTAVAERQAVLSRPVEKHLLGQVLGELQKARTEFEATYPAALKAFEQQRVENRAGIEAAKASLEKRRQEREARAAKPPKKPPAPPPPPKPSFKIDHVLSARMRIELFQRFNLAGKGLDAAHSSADDREIWEDWEDVSE